MGLLFLPFKFCCLVQTHHHEKPNHAWSLQTAELLPITLLPCPCVSGKTLSWGENINHSSCNSTPMAAAVHHQKHAGWYLQRQAPVVPPQSSSKEAQPTETSQLQVLCRLLWSSREQPHGSSHFGMVPQRCPLPAAAQALHKPPAWSPPEAAGLQRAWHSAALPPFAPCVLRWEQGERGRNPALPPKKQLCSHCWLLTAEAENSLLDCYGREVISLTVLEQRQPFE